jgi:DNA-binding GntR family transcriptional regulator
MNAGGPTLRFPTGEQPLSLGEQIANAIADDILHERLQPGEAIPEQHLAQSYQVSRGPIRDALRILEKEGVVRILPRRGARVTQLSVEEVDEIFVIRATLFGLAARLFADQARPQDLKALNALLKQMRALGTDEATAHAETSAQMALVMLDQCGNQQLRAMVLQLARQIARYTQLGLLTPARRRVSIKSWRSMLHAFASGDALEAEIIARKMVSNTRREAVSQLNAKRAYDATVQLTG